MAAADADGRFRRTGAAAPLGLEEALDDSILERVVAQDREAPAGSQEVDRCREPGLKRLELLVDRDAEGLEHAGRRVDPTPPRRPARGDAGDQRRELLGGAHRRRAAGLDNGAGDPARERFLAVAAEQGSQLVSIQVPGDFVDLHGYPLRVLDHDVGTLTETEVALVTHAHLDALVAEEPALARKLWFSTLLDAAIHREWIFKLGRLPSHGRVAHFLCETECRLRAVGLSSGARFELPLTQPDIAEVCGLTSIHVNRVLRDLRERGFVTVRGGIVSIHDGIALARLAEFDPTYLYTDDDVVPALGARPRRKHV